MSVTLEAQPTVQTGQPGQTLTYTLILTNSGSITETYGLDVQGEQPDFLVTLLREGHQQQYFSLAPQTQISVTVQLHISSDFKPTTTTHTFLIRAYNGYVADELELTAQMPAFQETNGQLVMEAERGIAQATVTNQTWLTQTTLGGYVGAGYVSAQADIGQVYTATIGPELHYFINFTTPGTYYVWLHGYAPDGAGDSIYVALDQQSTLLLTGFTPREWSWAAKDGLGLPVAVEVTESGQHTLFLRMREDGLRLDRILLTTDNSYNPSGDGPPESEIR